MHHAVRLQKAGVPVIGVPKTIDNDLASTDVTFGFDTALDTATRAIDAVHATAESHDRVMLVEVMGRDAGWIALCAGIAGGADVIVIPEIPYDIKRIVKKLERRGSHGATFSIVVVGEGARPRGGKRSMLTRGTRGHLPRLGGAAHVLADKLEGLTNHEVRVTVLGHLLRGGTPSSFDRLLATRYGVRAAQLCAEGTLGMMVALRGTDVIAVPIADAIRKPKLVPTHGELVGVAHALDIELGG
jgi:6-phosphofructokinase 1